MEKRWSTILLVLLVYTSEYTSLADSLCDVTDLAPYIGALQNMEKLEDTARMKRQDILEKLDKDPAPDLIQINWNGAPLLQKKKGRREKDTQHSDFTRVDFNDDSLKTIVEKVLSHVQNSVETWKRHSVYKEPKSEENRIITPNLENEITEAMQSSSEVGTTRSNLLIKRQETQLEETSYDNTGVTPLALDKPMTNTQQNSGANGDIVILHRAEYTDVAEHVTTEAGETTKPPTFKSLKRHPNSTHGTTYGFFTAWKLHGLDIARRTGLTTTEATVITVLSFTMIVIVVSAIVYLLLRRKTKGANQLPFYYNQIPCSEEDLYRVSELHPSVYKETKRREPTREITGRLSYVPLHGSNSSSSVPLMKSPGEDSLEMLP